MINQKKKQTSYEEYDERDDRDQGYGGGRSNRYEDDDRDQGYGGGKSNKGYGSGRSERDQGGYGGRNDRDNDQGYGSGRNKGYGSGRNDRDDDYGYGSGRNDRDDRDQGYGGGSGRSNSGHGNDKYGRGNERYSAPSKKEFSAKDYEGSKSISSADLFGHKKNDQTVDKVQLDRLSNQGSISSDAYYGRNTKESQSGGGSTQYDDLANRFKETALGDLSALKDGIYGGGQKLTQFARDFFG